CHGVLLNFGVRCLGRTWLFKPEEAERVVVRVGEPGREREPDVGDAAGGAQLGQVLDRDAALLGTWRMRVLPGRAPRVHAGGCSRCDEVEDVALGIGQGYTSPAEPRSRGATARHGRGETARFGGSAGWRGPGAGAAAGRPPSPASPHLTATGPANRKNRP